MNDTGIQNNQRNEERYLGKRRKVICGRISTDLYDAVRSLIGSHGYKTVNDFVEEAVYEKWISTTGKHC